MWERRREEKYSTSKLYNNFTYYIYNYTTYPSRIQQYMYYTLDINSWVIIIFYHNNKFLQFKNRFKIHTSIFYIYNFFFRNMHTICSPN